VIPVIPSISINDVTVTEPVNYQEQFSESQDRPFVIATFTVTLSAVTTEDVTVNFTTADGTAISGGFGVGNNDYGSTSGTLTIPAGSTTGTIEVHVFGDNVTEISEQYVVNLSAPVNAVITDGQGIGTILDNDLPTISLITVDPTAVEPNDGSEVYGDAGDSAEYQVVMTNASTFDTIVVVTLSAGTTGNPIELPADVSAFQYFDGANWVNVPSNGEVTIAAGDTTLDLRVNPAADEVYEGIETFDVNLTSAVSNSVPLAITDSQQAGTIADEGGNTGDLPVFNINDVQVTEGVDGTITFTVTKTGATELASSVNYSVNTDTALTPGDYSALDALSGTLNFDAGETSKTITLNVTDDLVQELTENFTVNLATPVNATISDTQGIGTILDNDIPDFPAGLAYSIAGGGHTGAFLYGMTWLQVLHSKLVK